MAPERVFPSANRATSTSCGARGQAHDPRRRIVLCVDDFGLHDGVNAAVFDLAALRRLSAVGCLVDAPAFPAGARALARLQGGGEGVALGLHLNLTEGHTAMSRSLRPLVLAAYARRLSPFRLQQEIERQLDAFEQAIGGPPGFVDGHQHVHQLPQVREVLVGVMQRRYAARLPWLRSTRRPVSSGPSRFKAGVIERLGGAALERLARQAGFAQNEHLLGVYGFDDPPGGYQALMSRWLASSVDRDLLMCHPSAPTHVPDPLIEARLREHRFLTGDGFGRLLDACGVRIVPGETLRA